METATEFSIGLGILIAFGMVTVMKYVAYKKRKDQSISFNFSVWVRDNWAEYPVYIFLTWLIFLFDSDVFNLINYLLETFDSKYRLIRFENKGFWFVMVPVLLTYLSYKFLRPKTKSLHDKTEKK